MEFSDYVLCVLVVCLLVLAREKVGEKRSLVLKKKGAAVEEVDPFVSIVPSGEQ